jgi:hypothetical protein
MQLCQISGHPAGPNKWPQQYAGPNNNQHVAWVCPIRMLPSFPPTSFPPSCPSAPAPALPCPALPCPSCFVFNKLAGALGCSGYGAPHWAQYGPKVGPYGPIMGQYGIWAHPWAHILAHGGAYAHDGLIMGPIWGPSWAHLGSIMGLFWDQNALIPSIEGSNCREGHF